ncbi:hypothetical protein Tco_1472142, partial [Tanacetum coccineum]
VCVRKREKDVADMEY